jgi:hypothetical protein
MNEPKQKVDMREVMFRNVRENARHQIDSTHRENYFRSCEAHGGELAEIVAVVRKEFDNNQ